MSRRPCRSAPGPRPSPQLASNEVLQRSRALFFKWMIGVPTSLPVSARASSVSRCSSASNEVSSSAPASSAGRPASGRMGSRKVRTPPGSSPHGCHLGRNAARGHDRPRPLHPVTQVGPRLRTWPFRVRAFTNRNASAPGHPTPGAPRLNVPPGAGLTISSMVGVTQVEPGLGQEAIEEAGPVSPCSSAIASRMGAIILHGPYHLAR